MAERLPKMFQKLLKTIVIYPGYDKYIRNLQKQCKLNVFITDNKTLPKLSTMW